MQKEALRVQEAIKTRGQSKGKGKSGNAEEAAPPLGSSNDRKHANQQKGNKSYPKADVNIEAEYASTFPFIFEYLKLGDLHKWDHKLAARCGWARGRRGKF